MGYWYVCRQSTNFPFKKKNTKNNLLVLFTQIICNWKLEDLVHNLKVSPSFIKSYEKYGYLFDCLLKK